MLGAGLVVFGWAYPHFLHAPAWAFLYAAPFGLIPCPTLSVVSGCSLAFAGFRSRAWSVAVGSLCAFYGAFGAFRMGVVIDLVLLAGALALLYSGSWAARSADSELTEAATPGR